MSEEVYMDKEMDDLNKLIQSASKLMENMQGVNPFNLLQQQFSELNHEPQIVQPKAIDLGVKETYPILRVVNKSNNPTPKFAMPGDSGFDLRAFLEQSVVIKPMECVIVPTGNYFEIPEGCEMQVRSRSGASANYQLFVLNAPGTIDKQYVGEVKVILFNLGKNEIQINNGDRIAQGVICPVYGSGRLTILPVDVIEDTERGSGGFGHTGVN
jgi:dUTP pyrophosphatase